MPTKKEVNDRVVAKLAEKGKAGSCPICGNAHWTVHANYVNLSLTPDPKSARLGGQGYPLQPVTCTNCGNTQFINLLILGFAPEELSSLVYPDEPPAK